MVETFVFWGASGHARVLADVVEARGDRLAALFDNNPNATSPWADVPLYHGVAGFEAWLAANAVARLSAAVAIGGAHGPDRCAIGRRLAAAGLRLPTLVHASGVVARTANVADGCHVLANAVVGAEARLGFCTILNTGAQVDHECVLGEGVHLAPGAALCGCIEVGAYTLIGPRAVVVPRVRIGKNVIVGAGSVVTRDLPDNVIAWGAPARVIKENRE